LKIKNEFFYVALKLCCFVIKTLNAFFLKPCFWSRRCTKLSY